MIERRSESDGFSRRCCTWSHVAAATAAAVALRTRARRRRRFTRDVAPIVFDACVSCHRTGGPGPFPLTTYDEVRRRATQIAQVTRSRFMPPWKVEPAVGHFVGQRLLTDQRDRDDRSVGEERHARRRSEALAAAAEVRRWLAARQARSDRQARSGVHAAGAADRRLPHLRDPRCRSRSGPTCTGIEFHPGNARVVHHANIRIDRTPATRQLDEADPLPGYDGLMPRSAEYPDGHFLGWTPGQIAPLVQPELAWTLEPGSDLVVQLHMQPSGAVEEVLPEIGFYFTDRPPHAHADDPAARLAGHRHPAGRIALRDSRFVRAAGRRAAARGAAARALPRQGDSRRRDAARRHVAHW